MAEAKQSLKQYFEFHYQKRKLQTIEYIVLEYIGSGLLFSIDLDSLFTRPDPMPSLDPMPSSPTALVSR